MATEQAVLIHIDGVGLPDAVYAEYDLATLEDQIVAVIEPSGLGEYDGHESGAERTTVYLYGPDAEQLFAAIEPVLRAYPLCRGARVQVRPGGPETRPREVMLT